MPQSSFSATFLAKLGEAISRGQSRFFSIARESMSAILKVLGRAECVAYFTSFRWSVKRYIKGVGEGGGGRGRQSAICLNPDRAWCCVRCIKVEFARKCIDHRVFFSVFSPWCCNKSHDRSRVKFCPSYDSYSTSVSVAARVLRYLFVSDILMSICAGIYIFLFGTFQRV